jgi:hypothetical protein
MRLLCAALLLSFAACSADEPDVRAINPYTGEIQTFGSSQSVPQGWLVCPPNGDCPTLVACSELDESTCLARSDCQAIYEPCSSTAGTPKFVGCKPKDPPPNVCAIEGESCTTTKCCDGLSCCSGVPVPTGAEYCTDGACPISDRNRKHDIVAVDPDDILGRLAKLQIAKWTYNFEPGVRHVGPMAQDFAAAFEVGATDKRIFTVDANGVALASIQALLHRVDDLKSANTALQGENTELREHLRRLEMRTARLERAR